MADTLLRLSFLFLGLSIVCTLWGSAGGLRALVTSRLRCAALAFGIVAAMFAFATMTTALYDKMQGAV